MYNFSSQHHYFWYSEVTDMRKSFNGLCGLVTNEMKQNPIDGSVFIFVNKRSDKMKLLVWDRNGFIIFYKGLQGGTFDWPILDKETNSYLIKWEELLLILEGIKLNSVKRKKRFSFPHK